MSVESPPTPGFILPDVRSAIGRTWSKSKAWVRSKFRPPRSVFFWAWVFFTVANIANMVNEALGHQVGLAIFSCCQAFIDAQIANLYRKAERDNKHRDALVTIGPYHPLWPKFCMWLLCILISVIALTFSAVV